MRLAAHVSNGGKSLICPGSGKDTVKTKGVHCEVESEGRWRQISGLTNRNAGRYMERKKRVVPRRLRTSWEGLNFRRHKQIHVHA